MKRTTVLSAIFLIAIGRAGALECHYCDEYSRDSKCQTVGEVPEQCDDTSNWCEVEYTDGLANTKQCSDVENVPADYTQIGPLHCKRSIIDGKVLVLCYCQGDNCNRAAAPPLQPEPEPEPEEGGRSTGFWVGVVGGPLLLVGALIGAVLFFRKKYQGLDSQGP